MLKIKEYKQYDTKWAAHNYSARGEKKTIKSSGCGVTCAAMVIQTLRPDIKVTPVTTAEWSMKNGYKALNQGTYYTYFKPQFKKYGLICNQINSSSIYGNTKSSAHKKAKAALSSGDILIACMGKGRWTSSGHFVVVYGYDGTHVYISDPASTAANRAKATWGDFAKEVKYYFQCSIGTRRMTNAKCNLYKKCDIKKGKYDALKNGTWISHIYDLKNGWSICLYANHVGYVKNTAIEKSGLSAYKTGKVIHSSVFKKSNSKAAKNIGTVPAGAKVKVITRRKYWTNVLYGGKTGYISTKNI